MNFTKGEKKKLKTGKLRPFCIEKNNRYSCYYRNATGVKTYAGVFDSICECNEVYDELTKNIKIVITRKPLGKGYTARRRAGGKEIYSVLFSIKEERFYLGGHDTKEKAHAIYIEAIKQVNAGTFLDWFNLKRNGQAQTEMTENETND